MLAQGLTIHVFASAGLQDVFGTARTWLRLLLDRRKRCVFLFGPVLRSQLVRLAAFVLVPRAIAWDAGFGAALVAFGDVWLGRRVESE